MVGEGPGLCVLKCALYLLNTVLTIMAIIIVCIGAGVIYIMNQVNPDQIKIDFSSASILVIVIGVLIILFVFCGCCGACLSAGWMLIWFSVILGCLLIAECVAVGLGWKYADRQEFSGLMHGVFSSLLSTAETAKKQGEQAEVVAQATLNFFQEKLKCCGDNGPNDYTQRGMRPEDYCSKPSGGIYEEGCTKVTADFIETHGSTIGSVVLGTMAVQLLAICLAIFLYFTIA